MKKILYIMMALMSAAIVAQEAIYAKPLRLHILANSDSPADQRVKLMVRDAILETTAEEFDTVLTEREAEASVEENLAEILETADAVLQENGFRYTASAELGSFLFPERQYSQRTYPAGEYRALRITLGEGEGHNWWCVLYPPLCPTDVSGEEIELKSYLAEWLKGVFS